MRAAQVGWVILTEDGARRYLEVLTWVDGRKVGAKEFKGFVMAVTGLNKDQADRIAAKADMYVVTKGGRATGAWAGRR